MSTTLFCYQPGDIIYVQVDQKTPVRSFFVEPNGTLREVVFDQLGMNPPPSSGSRGSSSVAPSNPDKTRMFNRGQA